MVQKARNLQAKQVRAQQRAVAEETEKQEKYFGSAKVELKHLVFSTSRGRERDPKNERFLIDSFQRDGCMPLNVIHHIPALISEHDFKGALQRCNTTSNLLQGRNAAYLPALYFPEGFELQCLFGRHRVEAAKRVLRPEDRWWVVELYSNGKYISLFHC